MQVAVQSHQKWTFFRLLCTCNKFSYDGLYWDPSPERGVFFRRQIHKRVGISLVEVYKRVGTYVIWASKRGTKGLTDEFMALKSRENVPFPWLIYIYITLKGMVSSKQGMWKGYHLLMEGVRKGTLPYKHLFSTPSTPTGPRLWVNVAKIKYSEWIENWYYENMSGNDEKQSYFWFLLRAPKTWGVFQLWSAKATAVENNVWRPF